jgi:hypothetical protein
MARAPARLAPPIKAWLRSLGNGSLTIPRPLSMLETKLKGHHPVWMMARISRKVVATPSPSFAVDYNGAGNSYDASNGWKLDRFGLLPRRHGAASHIS